MVKRGSKSLKMRWCSLHEKGTRNRRRKKFWGGGGAPVTTELCKQCSTKLIAEKPTRLIHYNKKYIVEPFLTRSPCYPRENEVKAIWASQAKYLVAAM